jgi:hypothetical protein
MPFYRKEGRKEGRKKEGRKDGTKRKQERIRSCAVCRRRLAMQSFDAVL